jgi:hypothetical protein
MTSNENRNKKPVFKLKSELRPAHTLVSASAYYDQTVSVIFAHLGWPTHAGTTE